MKNVAPGVSKDVTKAKPEAVLPHGRRCMCLYCRGKRK